MTNLLILNPYLQAFSNISIMAYMLVNQKSKFANISFSEIENSEPGC